MIFNLRNSKGEEMPLFDNPYFITTDVDGMTEADVAVSSSVMSNVDGDIINAQSVNPRSITITLRVRQEINPEIAKRYILSFVKPKREASLYLDYKDRQMTISGVIQNITMPRFSNAVAMQFTLYCSQPFWEDVNPFMTEITNILSMHHWSIVPKEQADIVMGEIMESYRQSIVNEGDIAIGMDMSILALGEVKNPMIYLDGTSEFFGLTLTMAENDILKICTIKGKKSATLNGESVLDKVMQGSTWLQLEVGKNDIVINDDNHAKNVQFTLVSTERYI